MEYHFTGTGGSPDFTFIADGIIDGTGKFIFYTAIKNIKVTRKGGNAALIITTAESGVKEQCVYLVDGKDETALKAALSEIGVISKVDIKRSFKKRLRRFKNSITKKTIFVTAAVAIFLGGCLGWYINRQIQVRNAANSITSIVEACGLSDVTVDLRRISNDGRKHRYYADVTCSNWGELKPSKMLQTYQEMENSVGSKIKVCKERVSLGNIYSGDDCYKVYTFDKSVYKNKDVIYKGCVPSTSVSNRGSSSTSGKTSTSNNKDSYGHTKGDAFAIAEKAVKGKLKSPSTAKFCSVTEATIGCSGNTWVVRGWVDAQNGFGATVRTQFAVTFTFASKDMYSLDSCIVT